MLEDCYDQIKDREVRKMVEFFMMKYAKVIKKMPPSSKPRAFLSHCSQLYAQAILDPFGKRFKLEAPCIPDLFDVPSYKYTLLTRGVLATGTTGFGFLAVAPNALGSDSPMIRRTTNTYAGNTIDLTATPPTGWVS